MQAPVAEEARTIHATFRGFASDDQRPKRIHIPIAMTAMRAIEEASRRRSPPTLMRMPSIALKAKNGMLKHKLRAISTDSCHAEL